MQPFSTVTCLRTGALDKFLEDVTKIVSCDILGFELCEESVAKIMQILGELIHRRFDSAVRRVGGFFKVFGGMGQIE